MRAPSAFKEFQSKYISASIKQDEPMMILISLLLVGLTAFAIKQDNERELLSGEQAKLIPIRANNG